MNFVNIRMHGTTIKEYKNFSMFFSMEFLFIFHTLTCIEAQTAETSKE